MVVITDEISTSTRIVSSADLSNLDQIRRLKPITNNNAAISKNHLAIIKDENTTDTTSTEQRWATDAQIFEYGSAANPDMKPIPVFVHPAMLHENGDTRIIPFDISETLDIESPCTSPNLMASFVRITVGDDITTHAPDATSQAFYVIRGSGTTQITKGGIGICVEKDETISWSTGDMFCVPVTRTQMMHSCSSAETHNGAALYWIHDEPLMTYLGVTPNFKKFNPTLYKKTELLAHVDEIRHKTGDCHKKNRLGVLLGNAKCAQTKTLSHVLWSLLNSIPAETVQRPHRHNSVALDLCVSANPGVYTLMGKEIDAEGDIIDPIRCDWATGTVFVTPPGWWHSHHNGSDDVAWVLPIQDAGLYTHQRTLDIRFVDDELKLHRAGRIRGSAFNITNNAYIKMSKQTRRNIEMGKAENIKLVTARKRAVPDTTFATKQKILKTSV